MSRQTTSSGRIRSNSKVERMVARFLEASEVSGLSPDELVGRLMRQLEQEAAPELPSIDSLSRALATVVDQREKRDIQAQFLAVELNRLERAVMLSQLVRLAAPTTP